MLPLLDAPKRSLQGQAIVNTTLRATFDALQRAEFAALVWDDEWRLVGVTE